MGVIEKRLPTDTQGGSAEVEVTSTTTATTADGGGPGGAEVGGKAGARLSPSEMEDAVAHSPKNAVGLPICLNYSTHMGSKRGLSAITRMIP